MLASIQEHPSAPSQAPLAPSAFTSAGLRPRGTRQASSSPTPSASSAHSSSASTTSSTSSGGSRTHRPPPLTDEQLVEVRAAQRTFEGAYIRTALGQFGFALVVLRIFTAEFYSIGALFAVYGAGVLLIALYRRHQGNSQFFLQEVDPADVVVDGAAAAAAAAAAGGEGSGGGQEGQGGRQQQQQQQQQGVSGGPLVVSKFRTSGNVVFVMTALSLMAYCTLLVLIVRLGR